MPEFIITRTPINTMNFPDVSSWPPPAPWTTQFTPPLGTAWVSANRIRLSTTSSDGFQYVTDTINSKNQYCRMAWRSSVDTGVGFNRLVLATRRSDSAKHSYFASVYHDGEIIVSDFLGNTFIDVFVPTPVDGDEFILDTFDDTLGNYRLQVQRNGVLVGEGIDPSPIPANGYAPFGPWGIPYFQSYKTSTGSIDFGSIEIGTSTIAVVPEGSTVGNFFVNIS